MNENDTPTNKQNGDDAPLFPARTFPAVYLTPGDHPPAPPMQLTDEQQKTLDKIKADAAAAHERAGAGIEAAFEKAEERVIEINRALVRLVEMLKSKDKAHLAESVDGFLLRLKDGDGGEPLVFDALLLGAELGADTDTGNMLRQLIIDQRQLADVQARANELNEIALRGYLKMEEVAQDATKKPVDTAMDIYRQMPMDDEARAVREAILNLGSIRKAAKSLGMNYSKARNVVQNTILPAYAKAEIPPERAFLMRPSVGFRRTPRRKDEPENAERDLYQQGAEDQGENES